MATVLSLGRVSSTTAAVGETDGERLNGWRLAAFSSFAVPIYAAQMPLGVHVPAIYAQHYGIPLATLGLIFLFERLWGAAADPLIGLLSDRTRSRFGRRRPWIVAGAALYGFAAAALFFPWGGVNAISLGITLFLFYLGWSMMQIPWLAWSGEISGRYHERTRIATYGTVAGSSALLIVLVLPTIIDQLRPGDAPLKLAAMGGVVLISLVVTLALVLRAFPETPAPVVPAARLPFRQAVALIAREKLLLRVIGSDFAVTFGQLVRSTLIVFFVTSYMGRPEWASGLFLLQFVFGIAAGPIWMRIALSLGKHRTAVLGELVQVAINLALLLVAPHNFALLLALTVAQGLAQGSGNLMLRAIVADVADKHRLDTGVDRTALFFSVFSLTSKAAMAAAVGVALPLVAWLGFDPNGTNTPEALTGLLFVFALGPAIAHAVSAWLIHGFPLDQKRHAEIRRALDAREHGLIPAE
ncbi:MFS transporter [Sphingomonas cavernae]|uniref:Sodium:melibiose symporter n=1 Tax=Sphingomonas cavernae TaxID=2320861 RepID=A0A418W723_9SPHN|nr:MFS transporter [Sphingomonas cavernae]RJF85809.1 sodium:melibiose symporter [Sphingomonas cavernae]